MVHRPIIPLDRAAMVRAVCIHDVSAPLAVPSLAFPGPSQRDRFSSLRRSNATISEGIVLREAWRQRRPVMVTPHVLLLSGLILNTAVAVGCASALVEPANTPS